MCDEMIGGGGQIGVMPSAVDEIVDILAAVLDSHTDAEALGRHFHAERIKDAEAILCTMAGRENYCVCIEGIFLAAREERDRGDGGISHTDADELGGKAHLAAEGDDLTAELLDYIREAVCAEVCRGGIQNALIGACADKITEHRELVGVHRAVLELSVGVGACSALAKLHGALGVEDSEPIEEVDLGAALLNGESALNENGARACASESQGGKKSCRTCADNYRAVCKFALFNRKTQHGVGGDPFFHLQESKLALGWYCKGDGRLVAGICLVGNVEGKAAKLHRGDLGSGEAEAIRDDLGDDIIIVLYRQYYVSSYHGDAPSLLFIILYHLGGRIARFFCESFDLTCLFPNISAFKWQK